MRSIGVFRTTGNYQKPLDMLHREITKQQVLNNIKPKVGVLSSSQLTHAKNFELKTQKFNTTTNEMGQALRRVRNQGCVTPPKVGMIKD